MWLQNRAFGLFSPAAMGMTGSWTSKDQMRPPKRKQDGPNYCHRQQVQNGAAEAALQGCSERANNGEHDMPRGKTSGQGIM